MAQVSASIVLNDLMSAPLQGIINTLNEMITVMNQVHINSENMFSPSILQAQSHLNALNGQINSATNGVKREAEAQSKLNSAISQQAEAVNRTESVQSQIIPVITQQNVIYNQTLNIQNQQYNAISKTLNVQNQLNTAAGQTSSAVASQGNAVSSVLGKITKLAAGYISIKALAQGAKAAIDFSDELTNNTSRLNLMNDGLQSTQQLQDDIFTAAKDARTDYMELQSTVASLGIRAGGIFNNNQETLQFAKNLSKEFAIAGASQEEQASATLQLTQALGSGVLRGEEFNAVFEAAPTIMQDIADYMGVPIGQLREMASEGEITADTVKKAMLGATDSIDKKFDSMDMTFEQMMTNFASDCQKAFEPVGEQINGLINSPVFGAFLENASEGFQFIADVASNAVGLIGTVMGVLNGVFDVVQKIGGFISSNWSIISPVIWGIVGALSIYYGRLLMIKAIEVASAIASTAFAIGKGILAGATALLTSSTWAEAAAQMGLNEAMAACPITWIIIAIIALIAIIFAVCAAIAKFTGIANSAFGVICGAISTACAFTWNTIVGVINAIVQAIWSIFVNPFLGIIEWVLNVCNGGFDSFGDAVANLIGQIISWFLDLGKVVTKIIDAIFGTDWTGGLNSLQDNVLAWGKNENAITIPRDAPEMPLQRIEYGTAWDAGVDFGDGVSSAVGGFFDNLFDGEKYAKDSQKQSTDGYGSAYSPSDGKDAKDSAKKTAKNTQQIADNTAKTTDLLSLVKDNLEKEIIARYTSKNNVINDFSGMTNNYQNSSEGLDFIKELSDYLTRKQQTSAEGV